jgi:hypothetical protein
MKGKVNMNEIAELARQEYKERMKTKLAGTPLPLEYLLMQDGPVTQGQVDAIVTAQKYEHRERIPEALRMFADLYNELTGQQPTKTDLSDWIATFEDWKNRTLTPDSIRMAWMQSKDERGGFTVGRPGALTVTAIGMKSKAMPAIASININAVKRTQEFIKEKEVVSVGIPEAERERMRQWKVKQAMKGIR